MKICISEQSISDFVNFFKNQVNALNTKGLSKEQLYKTLYNAALAKSDDPTNQLNKDVVIQHMLFLPIALNGKVEHLNSEISLDLSKTLTAMNNNSAISDLIKEYQNTVTNVIDVEENPITPEDELDSSFVLFEAGHYDVLTNQDGEYKGTNLERDPAKIFAMDMMRDFLDDVINNNVPHKVMAVKLGTLKTIAATNKFTLDRSLTQAVVSPEALVFTIADKDGNIILKDNKALVFNTLTLSERDLFEPIKFVKGSKYLEGYENQPIVNERLAKMHAALTENILRTNPKLSKEEALLKAKKQLIEQLQILKRISEAVKTNESKVFLLDVNPLSSTFGYINQNYSIHTQSSDVFGINEFTVVPVEVTDANDKVFKFYGLSGSTLFNKTVMLYPNTMDTDMELVNNLIALLTDPSIKLNDKERKELFKTYVNVQSDSYIKFKKGKVFVGNKNSYALNSEELKEALLDFFTKFRPNKQIDIKKYPNSKIITDLSKATSEDQIYKTPSGEYYSLTKPKFSFAINPKNTIKIENGKVVLKPISLNKHILNNSYIKAQVNENNELRVYHPRIGFSFTESPTNVDTTVVENKPVDIAEAAQVEVEPEITPEQKPNINTGFEDDFEEAFAVNTLELETVSDLVNDTALTWFNESPLSKVLTLDISDKKHPHAFAQWFSSGITLYKGSNNTLIYHEAWHAFTQGMLTKAEKDKLYAEVKKNYPNEVFKTNKDVEEFLAEKFRDYAINNVKPKGSKLVKFFANILDALKSLFKQQSLTDKYFKQLADGKIDVSKYNPRENMYWGTLNANIEAVSDNTDKLNTAESKLILDTVDALVAAKYTEMVKVKPVKIKSPNDLIPMYSHALVKLTELKETVKGELDALHAIKKPTPSDKMKIAQKTSQLRALTFSIAEFGNLDDIEKNVNEKGVNKGVIGAHITRGSFITETKLLKLEEEAEKDENDPFKQRDDYSLEDYADTEILQLLSGVLDYTEKGEMISNPLGVQTIANKVKVLAKIGKLLMSLPNEDVMFKTLQESNDPIIKQVYEMLPVDVNTGKPHVSYYSQMLWSKFFQTFNKSNLPLKQLLFERVNDGEVVDVIAKHGSVSTAATQVERDWGTAFENTPFIKHDIHGPYLDVKAALDWVRKNKNASPAEKLNAFGINITDNTIINTMLKNGDKVNNIKPGIVSEFISRLENDESIYSLEFDKRINSLYDLVKPYEETTMEADGEKSTVRKRGLKTYLNMLKELEFKFSNNYNSFMGTNAEGETVSEIVLNSSITHMLNNINATEDLNELIKNPAFDFLNPETSPFIRANNWMKQLFDENGKRVARSNGYVSVVHENFSGTKFFEQFTDDYDFISTIERGLSNMSLDANSKFITDVYLSFFNKSEAPRMADKSSSFHFGLRGGTQVFNVENLNDKKLMYNALEGYLVAEIVRINKLKDAKGNIDKAYAKRGQTFFIFDDLISNNTKALLKNIKSKDYDEVLKELQQYKNNVAVDVNKYFKEKTERTYKKKVDTFYVADNMMELLDAETNEEAAFKMIALYERNKFLYNLDFTTMFLGDPALYNVENLDFHKRIAGIISTGESFRHDSTMLQYFNSNAVKSREFANAEMQRGNVNRTEAFEDYNGEVNVGIINDHEIGSVYIDEFKKVFPKEQHSSLKPYEDGGMNEADGQGFISFDFYRMLQISQGIWSDVKETMYRKIVKGESYDQTKVNEFFESMKLQYYGPVKADVLGGVAFHKFNLIPLIPTMIKGTKLETLHNKMMEQGVDYVTFKSGSKLSTISNSEKEGSADDFYSKEREINNDLIFTKNVTHVKYLKNQIKIHDEFKGKVTLPTQMRTILYAGMMHQGVPTDVTMSFDEWNALTEKEKANLSDNYKWVLKYEAALKAIADFKRKELFDELGITEDADISKQSEKLSNLVRGELTRSEIDDAQINFLFEKGTLKPDISLTPTSAQVEKIIVALISKRMTKIKVNGEGLIQMASTMSEKQDSQWRKPTTEEQLEYGTNGLRSYHLKNGKIVGMEVKIALQGDFEKLLYIKDKDGKSIATYKTREFKGEQIKELDYDASLAKLNALMADKAWKEANKKLFTLTTSRIPGQVMNSLEFMEVKEFLPKQAGNVIIVPSEMVAKSGSDFDVDKLFTMMPNLAVYNGVPEVIQKTKEEDVKELNRELNSVKKELQDNRKELYAFIDNNKEVFEKQPLINEIKEELKALKETSNQYDWSTLTKKERAAKIEIDKRIKVLNQNLSEIFDALKIKKGGFEKINALQEKLANIERRIDGQTVKGLENHLIDVIVERLEMKENFMDLVRPNSNDLVDGLADRLERHVSQFDSYERIHSDPKMFKGAPAISTTAIFDPNYNINKQIENAVGMDTLGIGAIINKYYSLFTRIGMYLNIDSTGLSYDEYVDMRKQIAKLKNENKTVPKVLSDAVDAYKNYRLHFPKQNTKIVNGKKVTDLSSLYNAAGEYIPDILGQMINGWVDVAKKGWIFNIQGNKEAAPILELLFMAGVPVNDAVYFVSSPIIRDYLEEKRKQNGALSVLQDSMLYDPETTEILKKKSDMDVYKSIVSRLDIAPSLQMKLTDEKFSKNKLIKFVTDDLEMINISKIEQYVEGTVSLNDTEKLNLLNKFMMYEHLSSQITALTTATTFDTKAESTLAQTRENEENFDLLNENNQALPYNIKELISKHSAIGPFESMKMVNKLFRNFTPLKNNKELLLIAKRGRFTAYEAGVNNEKHVQLVQDDFISYLYQNESNRIENDEYNDIKLVEDSSVDLYKLEDGKLKYNPEFVNSLLDPNGEQISSLKHTFNSRNAALKFLTHYALIDDTTFSKDSMYYQLAKTALSEELEMNEDTLDELELTPEEYEENIQVAALEAAALLMSGNQPTLMNGPFSYAKRMLTLVSMHGDLKGQFSLLYDLRHNYTNKSKNLYLANIKETGYSKIYREDLEILKQYPDSEIQELFSQFDRFATLQSGIRTYGKFNLTSIINPSHISDVIGNEYQEVLKYLQKLDDGTIINYSVTEIFQDLYYPNDSAKFKQVVNQRNRGANYETDDYFDLSFKTANDALDLSLLPLTTKLDGLRSKSSTVALIFPTENSEEASNAQHEYLSQNNPELLNPIPENYDTIYISTPSEQSVDEAEGFVSSYIDYINLIPADVEVEFNITGKSEADKLIISHLELLGYKKHPMISKNGMYYVLSRDNSKAFDGIYNTENVIDLSTVSVLDPKIVNNKISTNILQLVAYQLADKFNKLDDYQKAKKDKNVDWKEYIRSMGAENMYIENAFKYIITRMLTKDSSFKEALINTNSAAITYDNVYDKLNNMYVRSLMDVRKELVNITAVKAYTNAEKTALATQSSGFLKGETLKGFKQIKSITGAEIYDGEVFNKEEADAIQAVLDKQFPLELQKPSQLVPNFPSPKAMKSIYYGPIDYMYNGLPSPKKAAEFPAWLNKTVREIEKRMGVIPGYFDTALINRYEGKKHGLGMHTDKEPNLVGKNNINPTVLTLSIGAVKNFLFEGMSNSEFAGEKASVPTKHGHVLVMGKDSQFNYKHGVEANTGEDGVRYSITLRHTPDVNNAGKEVSSKPTSSKTSITTTNPSNYINHSGGAYGADTFWDLIGREFGVINQKHYRDSGNTTLSKQLKNSGVEATVLTKKQMDDARAEVKKILGKEYPDTTEGNLQVRNYYQVANADAVYAIAEILQVVDKDASKNNTDITKSVNSYKHVVKGGTNTAVQIGIKLGKPVYVWDLVTQKWYKWDGNRWFEEIETPTLTPNFAGIGSRDIENYNVQKEGKWVPREQYKGKKVEEAAKQAIRDVYQNTFGKTPVTNTSRKTYSGNVTSLEPNQIFVFGSNPEGRHGAGAAKYAKENFGAIYGQGEGLQGQSYALPTKDLRVKENKGLRSISAKDITSNIKKLYEVAKQNPTKEFLVSDYSGTNLNGYTGQEMADMFNAAGPIPSNVVFNENFDKLISEKATVVATRTEDGYQYYGAPYKIVIENGIGIDVVGYKGKADAKQKLLNAYNQNPNVDPQNGKVFRGTTPSTAEPVKTDNQQLDKYELFPGVFANAGQTEALDLLYDFINSNESIFLLQGKGGTGKTTIIKKIVEELKKRGSVLGVAPSHKAKDVLEKSLNDNELDQKTTVRTLASALAIKLDESTGKFEPDLWARKENKVPIKQVSYIIIDESSMVSDKLLAEIKEQMAYGAKIIFMGDRAQLPPVGQEKDSAVFDIKNGYTLTEKMRQAATSPIIGIGETVSNNVESESPVANPITSDMMVNQFDLTSGSELTWEKDFDKALDKFVLDFENANEDVNYAKIITFNNENHSSPQSVKSLNNAVRSKLYGQKSKEQFIIGEMLTSYDSFTPEGAETPVFENSFDFIVENVNYAKDVNVNVKVSSFAKGTRSFDITLDVTYLDIKTTKGNVISNVPVISNSSKLKYQQELNKLWNTDKQMAFGLMKKFANLNYGYAITSHKAQGSTYKNVYVMMDNILGPSNGGTNKAKNQSLYVAVSRPKQKLVMVTNSAPVEPKQIKTGENEFDNGKIGC